jgi:hypothetical protein
MSDWIWDRLLIPFVTKVPGWTVAVVALAFYPVFGLFLPVSAGWTGSWLVTVNFVGVFLAALIALGWLAVQWQAASRRHLLEWTTDLRHLSAEEFEWFVGEVFRREGWEVKETGRQDRSDGNIDLVLTRGRERRLIQCKRWQSWPVGVDDIRAFGGTLLRDGLTGKQGTFVTLSTFTDPARNEARATGITLIDRVDLHARAERVRRPEPCPTCQRPMMLARSQRGWWFRCVAPGCTGKRDLGSDPARAVELLSASPASSPADGGEVAA